MHALSDAEALDMIRDYLDSLASVEWTAEVVSDSVGYLADIVARSGRNIDSLRQR